MEMDHIDKSLPVAVFGWVSTISPSCLVFNMADDSNQLIKRSRFCFLTNPLIGCIYSIRLLNYFLNSSIFSLFY